MKAIIFLLIHGVLIAPLIAQDTLFIESPKEVLLNIESLEKEAATLNADQGEAADQYQVEEDVTSEKIIIKESTPGVWQGITKTIPYRQMIPPSGLEVCFEKTTHIIFPAPIVYVDLGNNNIMAAKAGEAENVLRVKSADLFFEGETNLAVITSSGSFYTFNVKFSKEPEKLSIEMADFLNDGSGANRPNNAMDIFLADLNNESPAMVNLLMKAVYGMNERLVKHIGSKAFGIQYVLKGIYAYNGLLYFHTELKNNTSVPYEIDYLTFNVVDKQLVKRTTMQETTLKAVRAYNYITSVKGKTTQRSVFVFPLFTLPTEKHLKVNLHEKFGGRHQEFLIENSDLIRSRMITELSFN